MKWANLLFRGLGKTEKTATFSEFFLSATLKDKKEVFMRAARQSNKDQREVFDRARLKKVG